MKAIRTWGVSPFGQKRATESCRCPGSNCGYDPTLQPGKHIVGFSTEAPAPSRAGTDPNCPKGAIIFECPQCYTKFWLHIRIDFAPEWAKQCDAWPSS